MKALEGTGRRAVQALLAALALGTLAIPPLVVATSGTAAISATWTALRILGLYALTVVFLNIMTGSFRPLLAKAFKPRMLLRLHNVTGLVGLLLAVTHMVLVIDFGLWPGLQALGPITLYIMALAAAAALLRKYIKRSWRMIHRLNYAVFVVAMVHAFQVGYDLRNGAFLKVMLYIYAALVAAGFVYRLQLVLRARLKRRSAAA